MPGIPGTGLAGVFYALLILWMGLREAALSLRGAGDRRRWASFAWFAALLAGILAALWLEGWLLSLWPSASPPETDLLTKSGIVGAEAPERNAMDALVPALAISPFVVLAALLIAIQVARLLVQPPFQDRIKISADASLPWHGEPAGSTAVAARLGGRDRRR